MFLTLAAIYAWQIQAEAVITGVCETDFSGYPDCRDEFVKALNHAVSLGMARDIRFETPLMWLNKAETWALADYWEKLDLVRNETLTCYNGIQGDGCGECAACHLRANGLQGYLADKSGVMAQLKQKANLPWSCLKTKPDKQHLSGFAINNSPHNRSYNRACKSQSSGFRKLLNVNFYASRVNGEVYPFMGPTLFMFCIFLLVPRNKLRHDVYNLQAVPHFFDVTFRLETAEMTRSAV